MKGKELQITTTSEKGQIVIPQQIRQDLGIETGTKFVVYGSGDMIIFKRMELPTSKDFEKLAAFGRAFARKRGIKEKDVLEND